MDYDAKEAVFYNKVQVFNRDISIQVIRLFAEQREKEKADKHALRLAKFTAVHHEQVAKEASLRGQPYDTSIDVSKVTLLEKKMSSNNNLGVQVECYRDPATDKEYRSPFAPMAGIHVLDALAATGLRSIRYLKEIPGVRLVTINDLIPEATAAAKVNCEMNGVPVYPTEIDREHKIVKTVSLADAEAAGDGETAQRAPGVRIHNGDAVAYMYANKDAPLGDSFDVIDLDPYGTAAPFLDSAVQAVSDGGLLCVTCTDMAVLSGNFPEKCFSLYGTVGLRAKFLHEASLRTLLHSIDSAANRHKRHIVPWVSLSVDFYIRVFVRVFESPQEVKKSLLRRAMIYQSVQCESFYVQPMGLAAPTKNNTGELYTGSVAQAPNVCPETGGALKIGGPYWSAPIHDQNVVDELLRRVTHGDPSGANNCPLLPFEVPTARRIRAVLGAIASELKDVMLYYTVSDLSAQVHSRAPSMDSIRNALNNAGYRYSQFHHEPTSIKTDAPPQVMWDIIRAFCKEIPPEGSKHKTQSKSAKAILSREIETRIDFTHHPNNRFVLNEQGIADTPENSKSVSYSLTHRNDSRNKVYSISGNAAMLRTEDDGSDQDDVDGGAVHENSDDKCYKKKPRFLANPEKNWGPKRKAGRQNDGEAEGEGAQGNPSSRNSERHKRSLRDENGVKGRGADFYINQNKEKAEQVRAMRDAARAAAAAAAGADAEGGGAAPEGAAAKRSRKE